MNIRRIIIPLILMLCVSNINGQDTDQNYIKTDIMLDGSGTSKSTAVLYYDGLGRQSLTATKSANGKYIYKMQTYELFGRESEQWLPVTGSSDASYQTASQISTLSSSTYNDSHAYVHNYYDALDRIVSTSDAGDAWHGKNIIKRYFANDVSNVVKRYEAPLGATSTIIRNGNYLPNTLYAEETEDEDGHTTLTFKDKRGRLVLERRDGNNDTYYVYDDFGNLRFVLSPQYQLSTDKNKYAYEYIYDARGRCVKKILPGCEYIQYWYDDADRVAFSQDATLRSKGLYRFMLYDNLGRTAVQGTCRSFVFSGGLAKVNLGSSSGLCGTGYTQYTSWSNETINSPEIETVTYYDSYDFLSTEMLGKCSNIAMLRMQQAENANSMVTGMVKRTSTGEYLYTASYYNRKGLPCDEFSTQPSGALIHKSIDYSFTGKPISEHFILYKNGQTITTDMSNEYNTNNDALTSTNLTIGNNNVHRVSLLEYNDLDRMILNTRSGSVGDVSYTYNLRGWTTTITGKGFLEKLYYADGIGTPCYNGNISSQQWKTDNETDMRGYKFTYDGLNRLTTATYGEHEDMSSNVGRYDEKITGYTANSAITGLQRNGQLNNRTYGLVDDLDITLNGNQLSRITDKIIPMLYAGASDFKDNTLSVTGAEYQYNGNGALVSDANKGITKIEYDNMNNPRRIQFTNGNVAEYIYSASGEKLRTIHRTAVPNISLPIGAAIQLIPALTLSVDSTDYIGNFIFHNGKADKFLFDGGYCSFTSDNQPVYHYYTQDHLGNNRAVVNENGTLEQVTHYYPFGDVYGDAGLNTSAQPYKYNGKELDRMYRLDWYDYGARDYDAVVPMWTSVDPLCEKYYNISPYVYCEANPVLHIDKDGREDESSNLGTKYQIVGAVGMFLGAVQTVDGVVYSVATGGAGVVLGGGELAGAGIATFSAGLATFGVGTAISNREQVNSEQTKKSDIVKQHRERHRSNKQAANHDKHTGRRSGDTYGKNKNNKRGDNNRKYVKPENPNKPK